MAETQERYFLKKKDALDLEDQTIIDELKMVLSREQIYILIDLLQKVREAKHGEICLRISGDRLFLSKKESIDGGHLVNPPAD